MEHTAGVELSSLTTRRRGGRDEGGRDEEGACVEEAHEQLEGWSVSSPDAWAQLIPKAGEDSATTARAPEWGDICN